jgi:hypothetical protein
MRQPKLSSVIERRLLVNYRVDPDIAARLLPAPLRPHLVHDYAVAGICLLRLGNVRPAWAPKAVGLRSENAAHRIAVEWDGPGGVDVGVYIPRRDSASPLNVLAGGRIFPGEHGRADFSVHETPDEVRVAFATRDGATRADVTVGVTRELQGSELFADLEEASQFFRNGARGLSATRTGRRLECMELRTDAWHVEAGLVRSAQSSYFEDPSRFPTGSTALDCALVMRDVAAQWQPLPALAAEQSELAD